MIEGPGRHTVWSAYLQKSTDTRSKTLHSPDYMYSTFSHIPFPSSINVRSAPVLSVLCNPEGFPTHCRII